MKRMWFVSVGALPVRTIHDEWVDLKYLEKGKLLKFMHFTIMIKRTGLCFDCVGLCTDHRRRNLGGGGISP